MGAIRRWGDHRDHLGLLGEADLPEKIVTQQLVIQYSLSLVSAYGINGMRGAQVFSALSLQCGLG